MNEIKHSHNKNEEHDRNSVHQGHRPYWTHAHRDWRFWGVMFLMFAAIIIYVMSENLSLRPRILPQQPLSGVVGK